MPALLRRIAFGTPAPQPESPTSDSIAALIADLEMNTGHARKRISYREFREQVRDAGRSRDEAWVPIRSAARTSGHS